MGWIRYSRIGKVSCERIGGKERAVRALERHRDSKAGGNAYCLIHTEEITNPLPRILFALHCCLHLVLSDLKQFLAISVGILIVVLIHNSLMMLGI